MEKSNDRVSCSLFPPEFPKMYSYVLDNGNENKKEKAQKSVP